MNALTSAKHRYIIPNSNYQYLSYKRREILKIGNTTLYLSNYQRDNMRLMVFTLFNWFDWFDWSYWFALVSHVLIVPSIEQRTCEQL